jgi:tetratricopeptide (TPR) repeat protein
MIRLWLALLAVPLAAQDTAPALLKAGDAIVVTDAAAALAAYRRAAVLDSTSAVVAMKAASAVLDLAEFDSVPRRQLTAFADAERWARRAQALAPRDPDVLFTLARALGRAALAQPPRARVRYGTEVRALALGALAVAPRHPGALHVMGMWHAEVMRLGSVERFLARTLLGGQVLSTGSWDEAQRLLEAAVAEEPQRAVHHLDLAMIYRDRGALARARQSAEAASACPRLEYNDPHYVAAAAALRRELTRKPVRR